MKFRHEFSTCDIKDGGYTLAIDDLGKSIGISVCAKGDSFCKKTGRQIAESRAGMATNFYLFWNIVVPQVCGKNKITRDCAVMDAVDYILSLHGDCNISIGDE